MKNGIEQLEDLYEKSQQMVSAFSDLPERDIRKVYFEVIGTQIAVCITNMRINMRFSEVQREEFAALFGGDETQIDNYSFHLIQNMAELIMDATLFQTELVFRYYYSKLIGDTPGKEKNFNKIVASLFDDTENNWAKDECKQIVLMWTLRNTIHTGGIYFVKQEGYTLNYKGKEYKFEFGKAPSFLSDGYSLTLVSVLLDGIKTLFESQKIQGLGSYEHPNYNALGY